MNPNLIADEAAGAAHTLVRVPRGARAGDEGRACGCEPCDQCDTDGKRYILARRNEPGVRDPRALTQRERSVVAFAAMGHQNKFIGYLLGLSAGTVAGHLKSAQRKLGLASRAELIRSFASLLRRRA